MRVSMPAQSLSHVRLFDTMDCSLPGTLSMGFSRQEYQSVFPFSSPEYPFDPGIRPRSPALQAVSLPSKPPRKPKNTGVGSHSFLQGIFLTQGWNPGLPHCRQILYHQSHQRSPFTSQYLRESKSNLGSVLPLSDPGEPPPLSSSLLAIQGQMRV